MPFWRAVLVSTSSILLPVELAQLDLNFLVLEPQVVFHRLHGVYSYLSYKVSIHVVQGHFWMNGG